MGHQMDIDISHFSRKAKLRLYGTIARQNLFPLFWLFFIVFMLLGMGGTIYGISYVWECEYLTLPTLLISTILFFGIAFPVVRKIYFYYLTKFEEKLLKAGHFPKCYECNKKAGPDNKCPKCGQDLAIKSVAPSIVTLKQSMKMQGLSRYFTCIISMSIAFSVIGFMNAWKHRNENAIYFMRNTCKIKTWIPFYLNQKVGYKGLPAWITAISTNHRKKGGTIVYTIETSNGEKIEGVSGYELK